MNSVERVAAAIELREPDRVPVDLHNFQPAALATGLAMSEVFRDGELLAEAMLDGVARVRPRHDPLGERHRLQRQGLRGEGYLPATTAAPVSSRRFWGVEGRAHAEGARPVHDLPDVRDIQSDAHLAKETAGQVWICARADQGPMDLAAQLRGHETSSCWTSRRRGGRTDPRPVGLLPAGATRYACALIECGGHSTSIGEPVAGPGHAVAAALPPLAWQHEQHMVEELKAQGIILHNAHMRQHRCR